MSIHWSDSEIVVSQSSSLIVIALTLNNRDHIQGYGASSFSLAWISVYKFMCFIWKIKIRPKEFLELGE